MFSTFVAVSAETKTENFRKLERTKRETAHAAQTQHQREQKEEEFEGVFKVVNGEAEFVPIETGILGDTEIEVVSGLTEGTEIITGSFKTLRSLGDGDAVKAKDKERG